MKKTIELQEFERKALSVVERVAEQIPYVLMGGNHPRAAVVPYEDFVRWQGQGREAQILSRFDEMWSRLAERTENIDEDEIAADIVAARDELPH